MHKLVYLHELDSIRKTDEEITVGQKALYNEIVINGNSVVMTYNQIVESRAFFNLMKDEKYSQNMLSLFNKKVIRISQFKDIRTVAQYILNALDSINTVDGETNPFIFSGLPLNIYQKRLIALFRRSLLYSDLSELNYYINNCTNEKSIKDLFVELHPIKNGEAENEGVVEKQSEQSVEDLKKILKNLYGFISFILRISAMHEIYIMPKDSKEYKNYSFINIIHKVLSEAQLDNKLWEQAKAVITNLKSYKNNTNSRSPYLRELGDYVIEHPEDKSACQFASIIINICYNYTCEISICNISKHYNLSELDGMPGSSFIEDFRQRLNFEWSDGLNADKKYLQSENSGFEEYIAPDDFPDFSKAIHMTNYLNFDQEDSQKKVMRYEYGIEEQQANLTKKLKKSLSKKLFFVVIKILMAIVLVLVLELMHNGIEFLQTSIPNIDYQIIPSHLRFVINTIVIMAFDKLITLIFPFIENMPSVSESFKIISEIISDRKHLLSKKAKADFKPHMNFAGSLECAEEYSEGKYIDYYVTPEIAKYRNYRKNNPEYFKEIDGYPIADVSDPAVEKAITRLEETRGYKFGIPYKSRFNTLIVDPIEKNFSEDDKPTEYFPYERIVSTEKKGGVVVVIVCNDKFLLIKQFRHSIRDVQYGFLRGFAEKGGSIIEDAVREIKEELSAECTSPLVHLGEIIPDSGLTATRVQAYLTTVENYKKNCGYEGIIDIVECTCDEFEKLIYEGKINDGFTLAAYTLYLQNRKKACEN